MRVFVTAASQLSSIGMSKEEVVSNLRSYKTGVTRRDYGALGSFFVGSIDFSDEELCDRFSIKGHYSRTTILGIASIKSFLPQLAFIHESNLRSCLISGTSVGGMDVTESEFKKYLKGLPYDESVYRNHACGTITHQIMKNTVDVDMIDTVSTACSSAANAILAGANHIKTGSFDVAIVGGADSLSEFTVAGFDSLKIYDSQICRPFDKSRNGINLGEGAGFLLLESQKSMLTSGNKPLVELTGWGSVSDAYHQTASSPDGFGATKAMREAIESASLNSTDISFINAHGTATLNNDVTEAIAFKNVFGNEVPPFSSTKSFTGHTLAASSGIESVFSIYSMLDGFLLPNRGYLTPIEEVGIFPNHEFKEGVEINHLLSNAFGFGGNNTSLIFSKIR
jgi:3-oxoacyl-(acyl-carrier-protein) synthase